MMLQCKKKEFIDFVAQAKDSLHNVEGVNQSLVQILIDKSRKIECHLGDYVILSSDDILLVNAISEQMKFVKNLEDV